MKREATGGSLYRLIYCSRNMLPADTEPTSEVRAIVASARRHNAASGITGALLVSASAFAQVLEGQREALERTFARISDDPRHDNVAVLAFKPVGQRAFPESPLAFCGDLRPEAVDPLAAVLEDTARTDDRATTGGDLMRLLVRLVRAEDEGVLV